MLSSSPLADHAATLEANPKFAHRDIKRDSAANTGCVESAIPRTVRGRQRLIF
ncbi:MAG: hypothetical protein ABI273_02220 [Lacunisphaera sp.]